MQHCNNFIGVQYQRRSNGRNPSRKKSIVPAITCPEEGSAALPLVTLLVSEDTMSHWHYNVISMPSTQLLGMAAKSNYYIAQHGIFS